MARSRSERVRDAEGSGDAAHAGGAQVVPTAVRVGLLGGGIQDVLRRETRLPPAAERLAENEVERRRGLLVDVRGAGRAHLRETAAEEVVVNAETTKYLWGREYPNE